MFAQVDAYSELLATHPLISLSEPLHPLHRGYVTKLGEDVKQFIQGAKGDMVDLFKQHFDGIGGDRDCIIQVRSESHPCFATNAHFWLRSTHVCVG